jgi:hypothetical protein
VTPSFFENLRAVEATAGRKTIPREVLNLRTWRASIHTFLKRMARMLSQLNPVNSLKTVGFFGSRRIAFSVPAQCLDP